MSNLSPEQFGATVPDVHVSVPPLGKIPGASLRIPGATVKLPAPPQFNMGAGLDELLAHVRSKTPAMPPMPSVEDFF